MAEHPLANVYDEWDEDDHDDVEIGDCSHCGRANVLIREVEDPFMAEVYDEISKSAWCGVCWHERKDEV